MEMHGLRAVYWVLLCSFVAVLEAKLTFIVQPSDIVYRPGQTVTLNCQASDSNGRSVSINWKRNNSWLVHSANKPWKFLRNNSLYFQSISVQDGGSFMCGASISGANDIIYSQVANVQAAYTSGVFSSSPLNQTKRVGDASTYFTCVTGNSLPYANVYWEKDGKNLSSDNIVNQQLSTSTPGVKWTSSSLTIKNIDLSSSGFYRCIAVNSFVSSIVKKSKSGYLNVLPKQDKPHFQVHPTNLVASEHKPAILQCVILGVPKPTITWKYNGQILVSSTARQILTNGSLYFPSVNKTFTGQYRCKGSNSAGVIESSDILFSVAFFDFQFFEQPASQNITMGSRVTLRCRPPTSYPVDITINWFKNYQKIQPRPGITITSAGSLVFDAIKKSDEGKYFCNGENKILDATRTSYVAMVTVWVPPTFAKPPRDTAVVQHRLLKLHCEATGFPTPSILWLKDDGALNSSHVTVLANGSLVIQRVVVKDAGNYSCYATNVGGRIVTFASVDVYVQPSVSTRPSDAVRVLGQPITFQCGFQGNPTPRVEWYHGNNSVYTPVPTTPKYIITGGTLRITSVSIDDEGTFLCKGINVAGTANTTVYLNVHVPVSLDMGPVNITVNQSSSASFKCVASGDPKPNITWFKEGVLLTNGGRIVITEETLSITRTTTSDAGEYQCHVTNGLAKHVGKAHLIVQVEPNIVNFDVPSFTPLGGSTIMTCQSNGIPRPQITWYRDSTILIGSRFTLFSNGSLRIVGFNRGDGGVYVCKASNAAGRTMKNNTLTIQVPPDAPLQLSVISQSSMSIKLSWQPGFNGHAPITSYKVDMRKDGQSAFKEIEAKFAGRERVVPHLLPFTNYTFRVSARNLVGLGKSTEATNATFEDAPSQPLNIRLSSLNSTVIQISWSAPSHPNGVIRRYEIVYQSLPSGSVIKKQVPGSNKLTLVVTSLQPFTEYTVRIRALTILWGNYSKDKTKRTAESAPKEPPRNVEIRAVGPRAVFVSWKTVSASSTNGIIRKYRILYRGLEWPTNNEITKITVNNRTSNFTIQRLQPWTFYNISVQAYTIDFGPGSEWKTVRTHEGVPSAGPNVSLTSPNESSILATITPPSAGMRNGIIIGYNVSYRTTNSLTSNHMFTSSNHTVIVLLSNLDVYTYYTVTVAAVTKAGAGPMSEEMKIRTQEGVPSKVSITSVKLSEQIANRVDIKWSPPRPLRGIILHYKVTYNQSNGDQAYRTTPETSISILDLQYNTTYHIWVVAKTSKGYGMPGNVMNITTGTKPSVPPTTGIPTTPFTNSTEPVVKATVGGQSGIFLSEQNVMIILICVVVFFLILLVLLIYCGCTRFRRDKRSDHMTARKVGSLGLDVHELRGVSPDRRPVLDVQEETSVNSADSFEDLSDFNSSITGIASEQTGSEPLAKKISSNSHPSSEATGIQPLSQPPIKRVGSSQKENGLPYLPMNKDHLSKLKSKKLSLSSNDSFYDQPYSSVDELGTGFSSFTPPPPEDFRNEDSNPSREGISREPPKEFSNQLYSAVLEHPEEVKPQPIFSEYAEPEIVFKPRPKVEEEVIQPEVITPPPEAFLSDFEGVQNEGYNTDEELDNYLGQRENNALSQNQWKPSMSSKSPTSSHSPTSSQSLASSRSHSASPPLYATVDKSKKKKKKKEECDRGAVVVYDERTSL